MITIPARRKPQSGKCTTVVPVGAHRPSQEFTALDLMDLYNQLVATTDYLAGVTTRDVWLDLLRQAGSSTPDEAAPAQYEAS